MQNTTYISYQHCTPGDMFRFTEPSSGQFRKQSTFSECHTMGSHTVYRSFWHWKSRKILLVDVLFEMYIKTPFSISLLRNLKLCYVYILRVTLKFLSDGVVCVWLKTILSVIGRVLNSEELLASIFLPSCTRLSSKLCITRWHCCFDDRHFKFFYLAVLWKAEF